jgi:hypothetical protein
VKAAAEAEQDDQRIHVDRVPHTRARVTTKRRSPARHVQVEPRAGPRLDRSKRQDPARPVCAAERTPAGVALQAAAGPAATGEPQHVTMRNVAARHHA